MDDIKKIFSQLENRTITLADAEKQIVKLFDELKPEKENVVNLQQWVINTNQKEVEELRAFRQEYFDFWEWYEDEYGLSEIEIWDEYNLFRDNQEKHWKEEGEKLSNDEKNN